MIAGSLPKRINNQLALKADGVDQYGDITTDARYNFGSGEWGFIFFFRSEDNAIARIFQLFQFPTVFSISIQSASSYSVAVRTDQNTDASILVTDSNAGYSESAYTCAIATRVGNDVIVYHNGFEVGRTTIPGGDTFDLSGSLMTFFTRVSLADQYLNGFINNVIFLESGISDDQAKLITNYGGFLPPSLHESVLNHWPLTQKYYYDDGGTLKAWDVVEQYNYAKVTALAPIHATLNGFTASEIGADEPANQVSIYDVMSKQIANNWGLKFNGSDQYAQQDPLTNNIVTTNRDNLTLYARFDEINNTGDTDISVLFRNGTSVAFAINVNRNTNLITLQVELDGQTGNANFVNSDWDRPLAMIFEKTDEDPNNWVLNLNGVKITPNSASGTHGTTSTEFTFTQLTLGGGFSGSGSFDFDGILNDAALWDRILTIEERTDLYLREILPSSGLLERPNPEKRSDSQINTFAGNTLTLQNFTLSEFDSYYREKESGLPEIKQALAMPQAYFESTGFSGLSDTKEFTVIIGFKVDTVTAVNNYVFLISDGGVGLSDNYIRIFTSSANSITLACRRSGDVELSIGFADFENYLNQNAINYICMRGKDNLIEFYLNGFLLDSDTGGLCPNLSAFSEFHINAFRNGESNNDITIYEVSFFDEYLERKKIAELANNTLARSKSGQINLNMCSVNFSENGSNVKVQDYGSLGLDINVFDYAGATPADQLADLLTNIVDINTLR